MRLQVGDIRHAIDALGLSGKPVCMHSSLSSFGRVSGGAKTVVTAWLDEGCTLLVPSFSFDANAVDPPAGEQIDRNGWDHSRAWFGRTDATVYATTSSAVDRRMGAIPATVVRSPGRARGQHPLCSFAALGPLAGALVATQTPEDVFAPLAELAARAGAVVLAGVDLNRMTIIHHAERAAGRQMFVRWASGPAGSVINARVGGCSEGFTSLAPDLAAHERRQVVGTSTWRSFEATAVIDAATDAIRSRPDITRCVDVLCIRCRDGVRGGPAA